MKFGRQINYTVFEPERGHSCPQQRSSSLRHCRTGKAGTHSGLAADRNVRAPGIAAFTLAEVLAALVFVAVLIPVAIEGLHIASSVGETAVRKGEAAIVAERVLNESIIMTNWTSSGQAGVVRQGPREYSWQMRNEPWTQDPNQNTMRLVTVEVKYSIQGRDRIFTLSTLAENDNTGAGGP